VNLVKIEFDGLTMRTYERGVENETLSCGTGVTAAALAYHILYGGESPIKVETRGGKLTVSYDSDENAFSNIWLEGPAEKVFAGII
jgi:diaminopimelate epimerase